jgi:1,4-dihydroxy-2-naphthoate octaprenyltransferase
MNRIRSLFLSARPLYLLLAALTYLLGAGIARYLGAFHSSLAFWLGLGGVLFAQLSMNLLAESFRPVREPSEFEADKSDRVGYRNSALLIAIGSLATAGLVFFLLGNDIVLKPTVLFFLGMSLAIILAFGVPPVRLVNTGFGEFALAVHIALVMPALGFVFQNIAYHRLVAIVSFPLTLLALAYFLILSFPSFASDQKYDRRTLLRRMGWELAVPFHHGLILGAYLLLAGALLFGLAWNLVWPVFLTFPFAVLQIFWLRNISLGAKPLWTLLTVNALAVFGLASYLLTFAFWLR